MNEFQDDFGDLVGIEWFREHALADAAELIDEMGLRAFLHMVKPKLDSLIEIDNITEVLEDW